MRVRLRHKLKLDNYTESCVINETDGWRGRNNVKDERVVQLIKRYLKRGVPCIRYADDIVLLVRSKRASERLLESSTKI